MSHRCQFHNEHVQIPLKGKKKYDDDDDVIVYFCFPASGVAITLRPGDFLFIRNPIMDWVKLDPETITV
jgi:hypothetical protein